MLSVCRWFNDRCVFHGADIDDPDTRWDPETGQHYCETANEVSA